MLAELLMKVVVIAAAANALSPLATRTPIRFVTNRRKRTNGLQTFIGMIFLRSVNPAGKTGTAMSEPSVAGRDPDLGTRGSLAAKLSPFVDHALPGLLLCATMATVAIYLRRAGGPFANISPMMLAIVLGILFRNMLGMPGWATGGVAIATRRLLRFAIVLLGLQLTFQHLLAIGGSGVAAIGLLSAATFVFTLWFGRMIGCDSGITQLLAAGTAICGASAVVAANTAVRADDEDVAYAIASVTLFGTIALFLFPLIANVADISPRSFGFWVGASVHEVAQVVAAAFQLGPEAGETGTIVKLARVMLLAPLVLALGLWTMRRGRGEARNTAIPTPWFVAGFLVMMAVNSIVDIPPDARAWLSDATAFLMAVSLAAVGLSVDVRKLRSRGFRPAAVGLVSFIFIGAGGFVMVKALG